jgi:glycosyltransferase involved in cell wall biosynthesis
MGALYGRANEGSKKSMSKVWIDLTDIEQWNGNHGGTQRVVYGIASNYYLKQSNLDQSVGFFSYSSTHKKFYEASFKPVYDRVQSNQKQLDGDTSISAGTLSLEAKLKRKFKRYVPEVVKQNEKARVVAQRGLHKSLSLARTTKHHLNRMTESRSVIQKVEKNEVNFTAQDTVLMLGKPWDDLHIQKLLTEKKQKINFKLVQVVYDLIIPLNPHLHHPTLFRPYTQHMFEAVSASDLMLPISQSTASDLEVFCKRLSLKVPSMSVIRLGDNIIDPEIVKKSTKPSERITEDFIATVGTIEIRKNHMLLYYVYKLAQEKGIDLPQLVIVGSRGWLSGDFQYLAENDPKIKDKIIILDNVNDASLGWVYANCLFTVYPSMYEGWGLPIAESLAYGKPCLASHTSSMTEIAGDLIEYFSPYDVDGCLEKIVMYLDEKTLKKSEKRIVDNFKPTTWEDTWGDVVAILKDNT